MQYDIDGSGPREALCSVYTLMVYEQEFGTSLIKDVFGTLDIAGGNSQQQVVDADTVLALVGAKYGKALPKGVQDAVRAAFPVTVSTVIDYTVDNWEAYLRALWAMFRCADEAGRTTAPVPGFKEWLRSLGAVDMWGVSRFVLDVCNRELFRSPAQEAAGAQA